MENYGADIADPILLETLFPLVVFLFDFSQLILLPQSTRIRSVAGEAWKHSCIEHKSGTVSDEAYHIESHCDRPTRMSLKQMMNFKA